MDTGKGTFLGLALVALAIFAHDSFNSADAGFSGSGKFVAVTPERSGYIYIVNSETAEMKSCWLETVEGNIKCGKWYK